MPLANPLFDFWKRHNADPYGPGPRARRYGENDPVHPEDPPHKGEGSWMGYRSDAIIEWGFAVPSQEALELCLAHSPLVEIGCGSAYWASLLRQMGADIVCYDKQLVVAHEGEKNQYGFRTPWIPDMRQGLPPVLKAHGDRSLLLIWPDYSSPFAAQALQAYPGQTLLFVGESAGGCTGSDDFFTLLGEDYKDEAHVKQAWEHVQTQDLPQWWGIHDRLSVYRRLQEVAPRSPRRSRMQ